MELALQPTAALGSPLWPGGPRRPGGPAAWQRGGGVAAWQRGSARACSACSARSAGCASAVRGLLPPCCRRGTSRDRPGGLPGLPVMSCLACLACLSYKACLEWRVSGADHSRRAPAGDCAYGQAVAVDDQHHPWRMNAVRAGGGRAGRRGVVRP